MNAARLSELRALCEAATGIQWHPNPVPALERYGVTTENEDGTMRALVMLNPNFPHNHEHDAAFIAAARQALPEALDEIERLTKLRGVMDETISLGNFSYARDNATGIWWTYWLASRCCHDPGKWDYPLAFDCISDAVLWILEHGAEYAAKETPIRFPDGLPARVAEERPQ